MKKVTLPSLILFGFLAVTSSAVFAQVKVGDNPASINPSSVLEVESTNKGLLPPRVNIPDFSQAAPVTNPVEGLLVYNTNASSGKGFLYWDGTAWRRFQQGNGLLNMSIHAAGSVYVGDIKTTASVGLAVQPGSQGIDNIEFVSGWGTMPNNIGHSQWKINFKNNVPAGKNYFVVMTPRSAVIQAAQNNQADLDNDIFPPIVVGKDQTGFKIFVQESAGNAQQLLFDIVVLVEN